jgi:hypothetical protein
MDKPQINVDLQKTTPILTANGGKIWQQGYLLRKVSKFVTGTKEDNIMPIQIFFDPETNEILKEGLPDELRYIIEDDQD